MNRISLIIGAYLATAALAACSSDEDSGTQCAAVDGAEASTGIEIAGTWTTDFGEETISDDEWSTSFGSQAVVEFDNEENVVITRNAADAEFGPCTFSKTVWTEPESGTFHYCTAAFSLDTLEAARDASTDAADPSDLDAGCGSMGSSWTKMEEQ